LEKDDLKRELIRFIVDELMDGEDDYDVATVENLLLMGVIDSLGILRLVSHIEQMQGRPVPAEDVTLENFRSIESMADYVAGAA
jgi:acyl carrier protein